VAYSHSAEMLYFSGCDSMCQRTCGSVSGCLQRVHAHVGIAPTCESCAYAGIRTHASTSIEALYKYIYHIYFYVYIYSIYTYIYVYIYIYILYIYIYMYIYICYTHTHTHTHTHTLAHSHPHTHADDRQTCQSDACALRESTACVRKRNIRHPCARGASLPVLDGT
jgi:hypothetical protein